MSGSGPSIFYHLSEELLTAITAQIQEDTDTSRDEVLSSRQTLRLVHSRFACLERLQQDLFHDISLLALPGEPYEDDGRDLPTLKPDDRDRTALKRIAHHIQNVRLSLYERSEIYRNSTRDNSYLEEDEANEDAAILRWTEMLQLLPHVSSFEIDLGPKDFDNFQAHSDTKMLQMSGRCLDAAGRKPTRLHVGYTSRCYMWEEEMWWAPHSSTSYTLERPWPAIDISKLEHLSLSGWEVDWEAVYSMMALCSSTLRTLTLNGASNGSPQDQVLRELPLLESLTLIGGLSQECTAHCIEHLPALRRLSLTSGEIFPRVRRDRNQIGRSYVEGRDQSYIEHFRPLFDAIRARRSGLVVGFVTPLQARRKELIRILDHDTSKPGWLDPRKQDVGSEVSRISLSLMNYMSGLSEWVSWDLSNHSQATGN